MKDLDDAIERYFAKEWKCFLIIIIISLTRNPGIIIVVLLQNLALQY